MGNIILVLHIIFGLLFIFAVLIQDKGTGLSATFGGSGTFYASQRGAAKIVHYVTMIFCAAFFLTALLFVVLSGVSFPSVNVSTPSGTGIQLEAVAQPVGEPAK